MGNRAVITASTAKDIANSTDIGIYVHWSGSIKYIKAFLTYCKLKGCRKPDQDNYGWAKLCAVIANCTSSVGIDTCDRLDCNNRDNGTYIIRGWDIVARKYCSDQEQEPNEQELFDLLVDIDVVQPVREQLGSEEIRDRLQKLSVSA